MLTTEPYCKVLPKHLILQHKENVNYMSQLKQQQHNIDTAINQYGSSGCEKSIRKE